MIRVAWRSKATSTRARVSLAAPSYAALCATIATRLHPAAIPSGRRTSQRRSLWSTRIMMLALAGGWSIGSSSRRKPGPSCATGSDRPSTNSLILTSAEWPQKLLDCSSMSDITLTNAATYAVRHRLQLAERLGFGIHGTVIVAEHEGKQDRSAIKAHKSPISSAPFMSDCGRSRSRTCWDFTYPNF